MISQEEEKRCKGYRYPLLLILVCVRLVINASSSFRGVSASLQTIFGSYSYFENRSIPTPKTVSRWLTQVGHYKLTRQKERAGDWVYIIDNSIQVGKQKCMLILGFRMSQLPQMRALSFEDMEPIEMAVYEEINGEVIENALTRASKKTGSPRVICSDEGPDIKPGVLKYIEKHSETLYIPDTIHKVSNFLKSELSNDVRWNKFTTLAKETKQKIQLTELGYLVPPSQRSKSRFMNIDQLIRWALQALAFLKQKRKASFANQALIEEHLGWLRFFEEDIQHFAILSHLMQLTRESVRQEGIHKETEKKLEEVFMGIPLSMEECQFVGNILDFLGEQSSKCKPWEVLQGSSEIIESLFGKLKNLGKLDSTKGFTSLVLAGAACVGKTDIKVIATAINSSHIKDVESWVKENIGQTIQSKRRTALRPIEIGKIISKTKDLGSEVVGLSERLIQGNVG